MTREEKINEIKRNNSEGFWGYKAFLTHVGRCNDGIRLVFTFLNGYSASVIKHSYSYGGPDNLWEIALQQDGGFVYPKSWGDDVRGYLDDDKVKSTLKEISELPDCF